MVYSIILTNSASRSGKPIMKPSIHVTEPHVTAGFEKFASYLAKKKD